ncbi:MAG: hypothetical protein J7556_22175 [Acidovorax sp.]|nr:hypothetical protein [Acidovorax sp.]
MQADVTGVISPLIQNPSSGRSRAERWRVRGGLAFSALYLLGVAVLMYSRWDKVVSLELNALGDFFAGAFGPLALLWLVLGYFQQGEELKQNTEALQLQAQELANSVREQRELVNLTNQQLLADMAHRDYEKQRQNQRAQPIFHVKTIPLGDKLNALKRSIQLHNVGADCVSLTVSFESDNIQITGMGDNSRLPHSEKLNISVSIDVPAGRPPDSNVMTVHYVDGNATPQSVRFNIMFPMLHGNPNMTIFQI